MELHQLIAYWKHDLDEASVNHVEQWLSEDESHMRDYLAMRDVWNAALFHPEAPTVDANKGWDRFKKNISKQTQRKNRYRKFVQFGSAAAAVIIFAFTVLTLWPSKPEWKTVVADENKTITLPDGSEVVLKNGSEIKYPQAFFDGKREIFIFGEAFFRVVHKSDQPFIVYSGGYGVRVTGTSFDVRQKDEHQIEVFVQSGHVIVFDKNNPEQKLALNAHDLGVFDGTFMEVKKEAGVNYLCWESQNLIFDDVPLNQVIKDLERCYDKKITLGNEYVGQLKLTSRFENKSFNEAIEVVAMVFNLDVIENDGGCILIPQGKDFYENKHIN
jgi:ferric-dicitrate binding protein FerR (iron transport regulator)